MNLHSIQNISICWLSFLGISLSACQSEEVQILRPSPLPQDQQIQVYTNHEPASSYTEPYRQITRDGDNLEQAIIDAISSARSTVDMAVQEFRLPGIAQAMAERQKAGVRIRLILENTYSRPLSSFTAEELNRMEKRDRDRAEETRRIIDQNGDGQLSLDEINNRDALIVLDRANVPRIDDTADGSSGSNLMHHKFVVVDGQTMIVTSANFTTSDVHGDFKSPNSRGNANNLLKIQSPALATLFTEEFNLMWGDGPGGKPPSSLFGLKKPFRPVRQVMVGNTKVKVQFSPTSRSVSWQQSSNGLIGQTLSSASKSVSMALFVFSDQQLVDLLEPTHQRQVEIKALIDPGFAYRSYSEALDMMGITLAEDCKYEASNHPWKPAIATVGVPRMPPGDLLHHKFGIVDQQTVIAGSHNWTNAANNGNDETVLIIHNPVVAAHYQREFERLYTNAIVGIPPAIKKKVEAQAKECPVTTAIAPRPLPQKTVSAVTPQRVKPAQPLSSLTGKPQSTQKTQQTSVTSKQANRRINLNSASQAELETLPGIGPGLAKRIIVARQQKQFASLADVDRVSGVGPKLLEKLKDRIVW
ncbi:helix-hairpin-helix domain-containing protein [Phormidium sp. CLA17]|uniref:phospholipase D-like domain-containing protein n=1 Tax=Leptolyngbya sp. Cla-17 TaxID=2803751 RepID=UPI0018D7DD5F|nr:phospholipase D-like domain-containing protein [Leptolyngbya sp. Cla-17]MBM0741548.1 helix-hairpin-helix domain-containing protein [Leptolyngbya sp. Cla-17]